MGPFLTEEQKQQIKDKMLTAQQKEGYVRWPMRFLYNGQALNIQTGELCSKGCNVMHQTVYWSFSKEIGKEIAKMLNVKVVFSG